MRIAHITDLHYDPTAYGQDFEDLFEGLIRNLELEQKDKTIDLLLITGDLVDKGGKNFPKGKDPFEVMREKVIVPIITQLNLTQDQIFIIPGNHDVYEQPNADNFYLRGLRTEIKMHEINGLLEKNTDTWQTPRPLKNSRSLFIVPLPAIRSNTILQILPQHS